MSTSLFSKTPSVSVIDNRGLAVRDIAYHRHPDTPQSTDERITRHRFDARGFLTRSADPRLHDTGLANFIWLMDLSGDVLRTQSVDAGITINLNDASGRLFTSASNIRVTDDGAEDRRLQVIRRWQYEDVSMPGRPLSVSEQIAGAAALIAERFVYAGNTEAEQALNLAGVCVSHYDPAGLLSTGSVSLNGVPLSVTRQLLPDDAEADWQGADASAWNDLLAGETYTTNGTVDAAGNVLTTTDAKGNLQRVTFDVAGLLKGSWLTVKGGSEQIIVKSLTYSAAGQKLREQHGNGVVTTYSYEAETQRLVGIKTERTTTAKVLQDLRYEYDPVGNVLVITNDAEETRFWRNQQVVPENTYTYDSLYQLVSATGREMANAAQQSNNLPDFTSFDNATYTNYSRTYTYDNAGNLTKIQHSSPASGNNYTMSMTVSDRSNRAVLSTLTENPADVDALFTAGGQQKQLLPGQSLLWTARQELQKVTPLMRDGAADDSERYRYDASSQRIVKITSQLTGGSTQTKRVIYLPGLELRSSAAEELEVITVGEAGRAQVRVLHWESGQPAGISNDPIRYSYDNLTGSSSLEVDSSGELISQEEYYPFGGTALFAARSQLEADYKTIRYSGKEQDATGLCYYGYRYYQPWAGRWLSADPAGTVDGLNLFRMVRNNPVTLEDDNGLAPGNRYVYFPFLDEARVSRLVKGTYTRTEKNKWGLITVLKPEDEDKFTDIVEKFFSHLPNSSDELKESVLFNTVNDLQEMSENDQLIINSHGLPASSYFYGERIGESLPQISASQVAQTLVTDFELPATAKIKVSACYSAQGKGDHIVIDDSIKSSRKTLKFIAKNRGPFSASLAGKLEESLLELQPKRERGNVYGYLGSSVFYPFKQKKIIISENGKFVKKEATAKPSFFDKKTVTPDGDIKIKQIQIKRSLTRTNASGTHAEQI
ncbi:RHS repeat protein [Kosakonia sacchari]|uniref:RHS repeat protein n=1 Tax=Kosakonia sacchari TaxID=1158459 RepID=UPI0025B000A1|nr:RHS repeat domain-containing protein [Kosakonia sacchari]MDN2485581.1 RHS repeat protein [Kosakonia sacchari]